MKSIARMFMMPTVLLTVSLLGVGAPQSSRSDNRIGNKGGPRTDQEILSSTRESYTFHMFDFKGDWAAAYGINDAALAVGGAFITELSGYLSFLWRDGRLETLQHGDNTVVDMEKVNNWGLVSGGVGTAEREDAALYFPLTARWILLPPVPGKPFNFCMKINNVGIAVGQACAGTYSSQADCVAWVWNGHAYSFIQVPPGQPLQYTGPISINDRGQIVGQTVDQDGHVHPYLQDGSQITYLDYPGAPDTYVNDINNHGEVILDASFGPNLQPNQNYIWRKGIFSPIPSYSDGVRTFQTLTHGLNDRGDFSGAWVDDSGVFHPFVAVRRTPGAVMQR
ncbi:MAG: hypothetical protein U0Q18_07795 [Bryobacteraceae bacterium]